MIMTGIWMILMTKLLSAREPKRGVSDYHQRRMFAHGYHFIAQQVIPMTNTETEKDANTKTVRKI